MEESNEEFRKIQITGRGSYMIYLPKKWITNAGLKKGETIVVSSRDNGSLILTPRKILQNSKKKDISMEISLEDNLESVIRRVIAYYLVGYNIIRLKSREDRLTSDQKDYVRDNIKNKLVGGEIVTESQDTITIQILLSYPELPVDNALRRMMAITASMHEDTISALKDDDKELATEVIKMDDEVDRFSFYIIRHLKLAVQHQTLIKEIGLTNPRDCLGFRLIAKSIERIADHATKIALNVLTLENQVHPKLFSKIYEMSSFANMILKDVEKALFTRDYELAEDVLQKSEKISILEETAISHLLKEDLSPNDLSKLRIILESIRRIAEYGTDIAEIILNLTVTLTPPLNIRK